MTLLQIVGRDNGFAWRVPLVAAQPLRTAAT